VFLLPKSLYFGLMASFFILLTRLIYDVLCSLGAGVAGGIVGIGAAFFPPLAILTIIVGYIAQNMILLGTLRAPLAMKNYPSEFRLGLIFKQSCKVLSIRSILYGIVSAVAVALIVRAFGSEVLLLMDEIDPSILRPDGTWSGQLPDLGERKFSSLLAEAWTVILADVQSGGWPSLFTVILLVFVMSAFVEAFLAVPMAAAAFGSGVEGANIRVMSGFAYKFPSLFITLAFYEFALLGLAILGFAYFAEFINPAGVIHYFQVALLGAELDWAANPVFVGAGSIEDELASMSPMLPALIWLAYRYSKAVFWSATCALVFKSRMHDLGYSEVVAAAPEVKPQPRMNADDLRALRQQRMRDQL